jgi:hypothetical protein
MNRNTGLNRFAALLLLSACGVAGEVRAEEKRRYEHGPWWAECLHGGKLQPVDCVIKREHHQSLDKGAVALTIAPHLSYLAVWAVPEARGITITARSSRYEKLAELVCAEAQCSFKGEVARRFIARFGEAYAIEFTTTTQFGRLEVAFPRRGYDGLMLTLKGVGYDPTPM